MGVVLKVAPDVTDIKPGDRVASNGPHAEIVSVPRRLCALIPDNVPDQSAIFTVPSSIALQGIRLAAPTFGETFVVSGLGLVGLLTAQLLKANGCIVLGLDPDPSKCELATRLGFKSYQVLPNSNPLAWCLDHTNGLGVDGVLVTAATKSTSPIHLAAQICRQRGRVVLIGVTGLNLRRDLFYKKEISFQVSCSYGPGRYDPTYEHHGHDYPFGLVRWTLQRNFDAVLQALSSRALQVTDLVTHSFSFEDASSAYSLLTSDTPFLGITLTYPLRPSSTSQVSRTTPISSVSCSPNEPLVSFVGAGNYCSRTLLPAFSKAGACFHGILATSGHSAQTLAKKYRFHYATTDSDFLYNDPVHNSVVIATRHDSHAHYVEKALQSGLHVFVEKPLCLTAHDLKRIADLHRPEKILLLGFNRRFAPLISKLKLYLDSEPTRKSFIYTINSGHIPPSHWLQDPAIGGGRLIGEACHFVDLLRYLASSPISDIQLSSLSSSTPSADTFSINIRFASGSIGTVHYFSNGSKSFPKERLDVFSSGHIYQLDNFRTLRAFGVNGFKNKKLLHQDKGHELCVKAFLRSIQSGGPSPIPFSEITEVHQSLFSLL